MDARNAWQLLLIFWAATLTSGLLGTVAALLILGGSEPQLALIACGSFFVALAGTCGTLLRRRQAAR